MVYALFDRSTNGMSYETPHVNVIRRIKPLNSADKQGINSDRP